MDFASRRLTLVAALMTAMAGPALGHPGALAPARLAERPTLAAVAPLPAGTGLASVSGHTPRGQASSDPDDPPPLTPIRDPAPLDPPPPLLIVERTGPATAPLSVAPAPCGL